MPKVEIFQVYLKLTVNLITQRKNKNVVHLTLKTLSLKGEKKRPWVFQCLVCKKGDKSQGEKNLHIKSNTQISDLIASTVLDHIKL